VIQNSLLFIIQPEVFEETAEITETSDTLAPDTVQSVKLSFASLDEAIEWAIDQFLRVDLRGLVTEKRLRVAIMEMVDLARALDPEGRFEEGFHPTNLKNTNKALQILFERIGTRLSHAGLSNEKGYSASVVILCPVLEMALARTINWHNLLAKRGKKRAEEEDWEEFLDILIAVYNGEILFWHLDSRSMQTEHSELFASITKRFNGYRNVFGAQAWGYAIYDALGLVALLDYDAYLNRRHFTLAQVAQMQRSRMQGSHKEKKQKVFRRVSEIRDQKLEYLRAKFPGILALADIQTRENIIGRLPSDISDKELSEMEFGLYHTAYPELPEQTIRNIIDPKNRYNHQARENQLKNSQEAALRRSQRQPSDISGESSLLAVALFMPHSGFIATIVITIIIILIFALPHFDYQRNAGNRELHIQRLTAALTLRDLISALPNGMKYSSSGTSPFVA